MSQKIVTVLLSTYNGEKYLEEQLQSLLNQKDVKVQILVRDDGSTDSTTSILERWKSKRLLEWYTGENLGAGGSFIDLFFKSPPTDYYAFCDQDDIWLPDKLKYSLLKMVQCERDNINKPVIIHTDMKVVNMDLEVIADSFWRYSRLRPDVLKTFKFLSVCNSVNGCTMLINNEARKLIIQKYFLQSVLLHDVFISLIVAHNNGVIDYVEEPTVLYRQHGDNVIGARKRGSLFFIRRFLLLKETIENNIRRFRVLNTIGKINIFSFIYHKVYYFFIR